MGQDDKQQHQDDQQPTTGTGQMRNEDTSMGQDTGSIGQKGGQAQKTTEEQTSYDDDMLDEKE